MNDDGILDTHVCYRCGAVNGDYTYIELSAVHRCGECGEDGVITFRQSIDIINELVLEGRLLVEETSEVGYEINEDPTP